MAFRLNSAFIVALRESMSWPFSLKYASRARSMPDLFLAFFTASASRTLNRSSRTLPI